MIKYLLIICWSFLFSTFSNTLNAKQLNNIDNNEEKIQKLNINVNSKINKTKILFLEPCNITKIKYNKDVFNTIDEINEFVEYNFGLQTNIQERYYGMSPIQKSILEEVFMKVRKNLNSINTFDFDYKNNVCNSIDRYVFNNNKSIKEYILNTYNKNNDYVIVNNLSLTNDGRLKLELFVWDMLDEKVVGAQYYIINADNVSKISNVISDFVYVNTTTENKGIFNTKIMYVAETGKVKNRHKTIKIMEFNGDNNIEITDGNSVIVSPKFSKINKDEIFYLEYRDKKANFIKENIETKQKSIVKIGDGIVFAPNFNPKNSGQMVLSVANENGTNLYIFDMIMKKYSKITDNNFINTSPTFSPDGDKIVYVSDKTGTKKLHIYDINTRKSEQVSKNRGSYDKPSWSPDGRLIAFVRMEGGKFKLGLITPDGENERFITDAYLIEGLNWSPNSRYIMFSKQKTAYGKGSIPKLYMIDILNNKEILIATPENEGAVDPDWVSLR